MVVAWSDQLIQDIKASLVERADQTTGNLLNFAFAPCSLIRYCCSSSSSTQVGKGHKQTSGASAATCVQENAFFVRAVLVWKGLTELDWLQMQHVDALDRWS